MNFLKESTRLIKLDARYKELYSDLRDITEQGTQTIFCLSVIIGYNNQRKDSKLVNGGAEFRQEYLSDEQRYILYAILFDMYGDKFIENIKDKKIQNKMIKELILYSNGGMDILVEEVFSDHIVEGQLQGNYGDYDVDLLKYIYENLTTAPF